MNCDLISAIFNYFSDCSEYIFVGFLPNENQNYILFIIIYIYFLTNIFFEYS